MAVVGVVASGGAMAGAGHGGLVRDVGERGAGVWSVGGTVVAGETFEGWWHDLS